MIQFLRNLILHDFWLKLFSLALAVLIYLTVTFAKEGSLKSLQGETTTREYFNVPVLVMSAAADVRSFKVNPSEVQVTVRGDPAALDNLDPKDIRPMVDLTGIESSLGMRKQIEVTTPAGITYDRIIPDEVDVIIPPK